MIRSIMQLLGENLRRWFTGFFIQLVFFRKKSVIRKPQHINNYKKISVEENVHIDSNARLDSYSKDKKEGIISIGKNTMISFNFTATVVSNLTIGSNCLIASYVFITTVNHGFCPDQGSYIAQALTSKPVVIGNNCWIGEKAVILPGVTIGDNSVVGASSVVTKNIPSNSLAVGNPARIIKTYNFISHQWESIG